MSLSQQIKAKLKQEYEAYMADVRTMSRDDIISRIDVIADTTEILTSDEMEFDEYDAQGLLLCDRPLDEIVGYWQYNYKDISEGIAESVSEISDNVHANMNDEDEMEW